ncbi:MAG: hypothetical protein ABIS36_25860 [Chryseolinea sp.]
MKWFVGILVAGINLTYSELFFKKYQEHILQLDVEKQYHEIKSKHDLQSEELTYRNRELADAKVEIEKLNTSISDLECFRERELMKLRCEYCSHQFESIYKRASHQGVCEKNPKKGIKPSVIETLV